MSSGKPRFCDANPQQRRPFFPTRAARTHTRTIPLRLAIQVKAPTASPAATSTVNGKHKKQLNGDVAASENIPPRNWPSTPTLTDKSANNKTQLGIKETVFLIGAVITVLYCGSWAVELADVTTCLHTQ